MRILYTIEHNDQRILPALRLDYILQPAVLLGRRDRHDSLVRPVARQPVEFRALKKPYRHTQLAALFYDALQAQIVTFLREPHPLKRAPTRLDRLAHRIETVDVVHAKGQCNLWPVRCDPPPNARLKSLEDA